MNKQKIPIWGLSVLLVVVMALPVLILYAVGALATYMVADSILDTKMLSGFTLSAFGVAAILSLKAGKWVKSIGVKRSLYLHFVAVAVGFFCLVRSDSFILMIVSVAICGISLAMSNPLTNQIIILQVPTKSKAAMVGFKQAGVQMSALVAGMIFPLLAQQWGWRTAFSCVIPVSIIMLIVAFLFDWETTKTSAAKVVRQAKFNSHIGTLMMMQACAGLFLAPFITFVPSFAVEQGMSVDDAAFLITVFGLMGIFSRMFMTSLSTKFDSEAGLILVLIIIAATAVILTFTATEATIWQIYAGVIGVGATIVATNALAMAMIMRHDCFGDVPYASGLVSAAFFTGLALGPLLFQLTKSLILSSYSGLGFMLAVLLLFAVSVISLSIPAQELQEVSK
ncbi:MAG: MFS transporter [Gammaproteobacteria bacterium]|nr:MFS transporter [Gammaproteobacteria bacterium]